MKFIKAHLWLHRKAMRGSVTDLPIHEIVASAVELEYFKVLLEDDLIVFDDGKYMATEQGILVIDTISAFREL